MERALCESVRRPRFEFGFSTDSLLGLVQLLKYLYIILVSYWSVFVDLCFSWLWVNIFWLLYMSSNFLLHGRHCGAMWLSIWTSLSSFKGGSLCFGRQLIFSRNCLIPLSPIFKLCSGGSRVTVTPRIAQPPYSSVTPLGSPLNAPGVTTDSPLCLVGTQPFPHLVRALGWLFSLPLLSGHFFCLVL